MVAPKVPGESLVCRAASSGRPPCKKIPGLWPSSYAWARNFLSIDRV